MTTSTHHSSAPAPGGRPPLLTPRAALILALALLCGIGIAWLTLAAGDRSWADAGLAGFGAFASAVLLLNEIIGE